MTRIIAICAAVVALGFMALTLYLGTGGDSDDKYAQCKNSAVAGDSDLGGPFELVNSAGQTVTDTDVITEPSLIYFGYTFCPDVCPLDNSRNALATELLEAEGHIVQPMFISIDPARDTPEVVGEFASFFHERMIGLTGSDEQVRAASLAYRTFFARHDAEDEFYLVDHSTFSYFVLPGHGTVEVFRHEMTGEQVAQTAQCFLERL